MTYEEAMEFLLGTETLGSILERDVIARLLHELGNPQDQLHYVHIAGTNGKGSVSAMTSAILTAAGYRTGLYTSPFIQQFNERIQVDGVQITNEELTSATEAVAAATERLVAQGCRRPTIFELITAVGFLHFQRCGCDIVALEVGLGGRQDATNVIPCPDCAVIAHIGYDHMEVLGDTLEKIAAEKGGIIKPGGDVVLYGQQTCVHQVIEEICQARGCTLTVADVQEAKLRSCSLEGSVFDYRQYQGLELHLLGRYQLDNAVTAITAAEVLARKGYNITEAHIREGLRRAYWPGRLELLRRDPVVLVDGAHNPQGASALMDSLRTLFPGRKITFVMGVLADKDYEQSIAIALPLARRFYAITPHSERALTSAQLAEVLRQRTNSPVLSYQTIPEALDAALGDAGPEDILCIFGSLYQVGEIRAYFGRTTWGNS